VSANTAKCEVRSGGEVSGREIAEWGVGRSYGLLLHSDAPDESSPMDNVEIRAAPFLAV
jgi:hypothetical protein